MDYVVGSVAALISGNVTPNRPKALKRALTPMKHQQSPNVTPKSELVTDRSIFLSPTMQKKKAIIKKSPKRIFQNPDLDLMGESETASNSPKADKVKKHLKEDLEANVDVSPTVQSSKSPKNKLNKKKLSVENTESENVQNTQTDNENTPKKKKKKQSLDNSETVDSQNTNDVNMNNESVQKNSPKKKKKSNNFTVEDVSETQDSLDKQESVVEKSPKKNKKKSKNSVTAEQTSSVNEENDQQSKKKKNKKQKNKTKNAQTSLESEDNKETDNSDKMDEEPYINPNAITSQDTDSEHDSDDDIDSENEEDNKAALDPGPEPSSDEEEEKPETKKQKTSSEEVQEPVKKEVRTEEEIKRTLFVGNVPFSSKCKKDIKKIFSKYGDIETVRIRTVPVKDGRVTPKVAVIKNELHPDRTTVNVYIKYKNPSSVNEALVENNTVLNDHHLRVSRSDVTGSEHDPKCSIFVGNIPFALEDEGLRAKFDKCGEIESVRIIRDKKTNAGKGFGYVNFVSKDGVELALALTEEDLTIKNRILRVKRCTQPTTNKQQKNQGKQHNNQGRQHNNQGRQHNNQASQYNNQGRQFNNQGRQNNNQGRQNNNQGRQNNNQGRQFNNQRGMNVKGGQTGRFGNDRFQRRGEQNDSKGEGAYRRIMNKRKPEDGNDGPPNKRPRDLNQPNKEKKTRKEFVGMTAEKKKFQKKKLNKDQKKKKVISEILTK